MKFLTTAVLLLAIPTAAKAQIRDFNDLVGFILSINQLLVAVIFALTFLVIAWGIIRAWIINGGDEKEVEKGKKIVTTGVIVLVIMSGIWGILAFLRYGIFGV